jgi:hypothetical protein
MVGGMRGTHRSSYSEDFLGDPLRKLILVPGSIFICLNASSGSSLYFCWPNVTASFFRVGIMQTWGVRITVPTFLFSGIKRQFPRFFRRITNTYCCVMHLRRKCMCTLFPQPARRTERTLNSAWIGSIQIALTSMPAVLVGRIFDLGYLKVPFFLGTVGMTTSLFLVAECKQYWQFLLVQGVLYGVGFQIVFNLP